MFSKAQESDLCQYEVGFNDDWKETREREEEDGTHPE